MGPALAEKLSSRFYDGDDFHSEENKEKMSSGLALTDQDRLPWLELLSSLLAREQGCVLACSALKKSYRLVVRTDSLRKYTLKTMQRNSVSEWCWSGVCVLERF